MHQVQIIADREQGWSQTQEGWSTDPKKGDQQTQEMVVRRGLKDATNKLWLKFEELKQEAKKRANQEEGW